MLVESVAAEFAVVDNSVEIVNDSVAAAVVVVVTDSVVVVSVAVVVDIVRRLRCRGTVDIPRLMMVLLLLVPLLLGSGVKVAASIPN